MVAVQDEEGGVVDWEDERIMSWSGVEREENAEYLEMALRTQKGLETLEVSYSLYRLLSSLMNYA